MCNSYLDALPSGFVGVTVFTNSDIDIDLLSLEDPLAVSSPFSIFPLGVPVVQKQQMIVQQINKVLIFSISHRL